MGFSYSPKVITDGLVLYLDAANPLSYASGSTSWNDLSRGRNNGTLVNGPSFDSANKGSIDFDGVNDYVDLGNPLSIYQLDGLTISTWVYIHNFSAGADAFASTDGNTRGWYLGTWNHPNTGNIDIVRWLVSTDGSTTDALNTSELHTNQWYHITSTWDSDNMKIYVDGLVNNSISTTNTSAPLPSSPNTLRLGERYSNSQFFNGNISNIQIYNRALSAQEVQRNYQALKSRFGL